MNMQRLGQLVADQVKTVGTGDGAAYAQQTVTAIDKGATEEPISGLIKTAYDMLSSLISGKGTEKAPLIIDMLKNNVD